MAGWFTRGGRRFHADGPTQAAALAARGWTLEVDDGRPLDDLTVAELRTYAADHDIDLGGATLKADIVTALTQDVVEHVGLTVDHGLHGPVAEDTLRRAVADETTHRTP